MTLLLSYFNKDTNLNSGVLSQAIILKLSHVVTIIPFTIQIDRTALTIASFKDHHKVVELLLGAGANPDLQDKVRTH